MYKQSIYRFIASFLVIIMSISLVSNLSFAEDVLIPPGQTPGTPKPGGTPEPIVTPAQVQPAEAVPLGIGATFTLFSADTVGVSAASAQAVGAVIGGSGAVNNPDGTSFKGPFTLSNVSPVSSGIFGTADIVATQNAYISKSSAGATWNTLQSYITGGTGGKVIYKPLKEGWLKGVDTKLSTFLFSNSCLLKGMQAIVEYAGGTTTVNLDASNLTKGHMLVIGTFNSVKSVTISTTASSFLPPVTFEVVNDHNSANPNPVIKSREYVKPQASTVPGELYTPNPTSNPDIKVRINEICTDNVQGSVDSFNLHSDWIELYNFGSTEIDISGWGISDNPIKSPGKCKFPEGTKIAAGGYLIVRASDGKNKIAILQNNEYFVNFNIDKGGEPIGLVNASGVTVDFIDTPELETDKTFSRYPDGAGTFRFTNPTISATNIDGEVYIEKPEMSYQSGFYVQPINVSITGGAGTIRYTTDGSDPTASSPIFGMPISVIDKASSANIYSAIVYYAAPNNTGEKTIAPALPVDKATIVRAAVFDENGNRSEIATKTYFIGHDMSRNFNNIPVISLVSDPKNFFDNGNNNTDPAQNTGIGLFTHSLNSLYDGDAAVIKDPLGLDWQRPVHVTMFDSDGSVAFHQNAGMATRGLGSSGDMQKGLAIKASSDYGHNQFDYPIFGEQYQADGVTPKTSYSNFALKQGGRMNKTPRYIDSAVISLCRDLNIGALLTRNSVVFIDGEFWGIYNMEERTDNDYIEQNYGVDKDDAIITKGGHPKGTTTSTEVSMLGNVKSTLNSLPNTAAGYQTIDSLIDIEEVMKYYAANLNACNIDWEAAGYNIALWRSRTVTDKPYQDGKVRLLYNDLDCAYFPASPSDTNNMADYLKTSGGSWLTPLLKNTYTKGRFANTLFDVFNSSLEAERVYDELVYWKDELAPTFTATTNRWGYTGLDTEVNSYFWRTVGRRPYLANVFKTGLGMQGTLSHINVRVNDINGGTVKVNSINPDFSNGSWGGFYYTDYTTKLMAEPAPGYRFVGWQASDGTVLSSQDATTYVTLNPNGSMVTALFSDDPNWTPPPSPTPGIPSPTPSPTPTPSPSPSPSIGPIGVDKVYDDFSGWTVSSGTTIATSDKAVSWETDSRLYTTPFSTWFGSFSTTIGGRSSTTGPLGMSYQGDFEGKMAYIGLLYHGSLGDKFSVINDGFVDGYEAWDYHYAYLLSKLQVFAGPDKDNLQKVDITHITGGLAPPVDNRAASVGLIIDQLPTNTKYVKILISNTNWVDKILFVDINNANKAQVMDTAIPVKGGTIISSVNRKATNSNQINAVTLLGEPRNGMVVLAKYKDEKLTGIKLINITTSNFNGPIATAMAVGETPENGLMTLADGETFKAMFIDNIGSLRPISIFKEN